MIETIRELEAALEAEGIPALDNDRIQREYRHDETADDPWSVRVMIGLSAWISAALLLAFLFGMRLIEEGQASLVTGAVALAVTAVGRRRFRHSTFFGQLFLVLALSGLSLVLTGLADVVENRLIFGATVFLSGAAAVVIFPDRITRFVGTFVAFGGALIAAYETESAIAMEALLTLLAVGTVLLWEFEAFWIHRISEGFQRPVAFGVSTSFMTLLLVGLVESGGVIEAIDSPASTIIIAILFGLAAVRVVRLTARNRSPGVLAAVLTIVGLLAWLTADAPGILSSVLLLALAFRRDSGSLMVLALIFLGVFLTVFYYSMEISLANKAAMLASTGIVLLVARSIMVRVLARLGQPNA